VLKAKYEAGSKQLFRSRLLPVENIKYRILNIH